MIIADRRKGCVKRRETVVAARLKVMEVAIKNILPNIVNVESRSPLCRARNGNKGNGNYIPCELIRVPFNSPSFKRRRLVTSVSAQRITEPTKANVLGSGTEEKSPNVPDIEAKPAFWVRNAKPKVLSNKNEFHTAGSSLTCAVAKIEFAPIRFNRVSMLNGTALGSETSAGVHG